MAIEVRPAAAILQAWQKQKFGAGPFDVDWSVSPLFGSIDKEGVYKAPGVVLIGKTVLVTATDKNDPSNVGVAEVTLSAAPVWIALVALYLGLLCVALPVGVLWLWNPAVESRVRVSADPPNSTLEANQTIRFHARVENSADDAVSWSTNQGIINPSTGQYLAPGGTTLQTAIITATHKDGTHSGSAMVILPGTGKGLVLTPAFVEFRQGGENKPVPFAVERDSPAKIRWSVNPAVGTISPTGVYAPPAEIPRPARVIVTAVDETDNRKIASASVYLLPPGDALTPWDSPQHDRRTLLFVMIVGMLGTVLGSSRSFVNFLGNRQFVPSWGLFYVFRPVFGAGLAALIYFGYRSGAVGGVPGASPNSMASVAFVAGLVGLFADVVLEKLREIVMVAFRPMDTRADKMSGTTASTTTTTVTTASTAAGPAPEI